MHLAYNPVKCEQEYRQHQSRSSQSNKSPPSMQQQYTWRELWIRKDREMEHYTEREPISRPAHIKWILALIFALSSASVLGLANSGEATASTARNDATAVGKSMLVAFVDFGGNQSSSNGTFRISWNSEGIINWT